MHPCCEPLWQLSPVTGSTRYQADVEKRNRPGSSGMLPSRGRLCGGKDFECVYKTSRGFFLPEYAQYESVRVFLFSVGQRGRA